MFALVIAACLTVPATDVSPRFQTCSLVRAHRQFDDTKACETYEVNFARELQKDKRFQVSGHKCVDSAKLDSTLAPHQDKPQDDKKQAPPAPNSVDPKLKPLTPEQKSQGVESL